VTAERQPLPAVFSHIPKAGGSTVYSILARNYGDGLEPAYGPRRSELAARLSSVVPGGAVTCIAGHQPLGTYSAAFHHLIVFRDPVARITSLYRYLRRRDGVHGPTWRAAISNDLPRFIEAVPLETVNTQLRFASGGADPVRSDRDDVLEATIARLSSPGVSVGVLDLMPETIFLFARTLGWRKRYYLSRNVAPSGAGARHAPAAGADPIGAGAARELREATVLDERLVGWARRRLIDEVAALSSRERGELEAFRSRLRLLARVGRRIPPGRLLSSLEQRLP